MQLSMPALPLSALHHHVAITLLLLVCILQLVAKAEGNVRHHDTTSTQHDVRRQLQDSFFIPMGIQQSQEIGVSSYPTDAALWNGASSSLWIVGTRFAGALPPECFMTRIPLDGGDWSLDGSTEYLSSPSSWEACTALSLGMSPEDGSSSAKAIVAGFSQRPILFANSTGTAPYRAFTVDSYPAFGPVPRALLDSTMVSSPGAVTVPVASVSQGNVRSAVGETTWILSMDIVLSSESMAGSIITGRSEPLGAAAANSFSVHRWNQMDMRQTGLQRTFSGTWNNMPVTILPAGMLVFQNGGLLIVAGSTFAQGSVFGPKRFGTGNDLDGFVLKLDGERGEPWVGGQGDIPASHVFESVNEQEDRIEAICANEGTDPDHFFVLGSTLGSIADSADPILLAKVNVRTLERVWISRLAVNGEVHGRSCSVTSDGADVYVTGVLYDGAILTSFGPVSSSGGHDIFVAKARSNTGEFVWAKQIGSPSNDIVSSIVTNEADNGAFVVSHSSGSWYREKMESNVDLILFSISRDDGTYLPLGTNGLIATPVETPVAATVAPVALPVAAPVALPVEAPMAVVAPASAPIAVPVVITAPIASPLAAPVASPLAAPVASPLAAPVASPLAAPVASPLVAPVASPLAVAPVASPVAAPFSLPISSPVDAPAAPVMAAPVAPPVTAPVAAMLEPASAIPVDTTESPVVMQNPPFSMANQTQTPSVSPSNGLIDTAGASTRSLAEPCPHFARSVFVLIAVLLVLS